MYELELRHVTGEVRAIDEDDGRFLVGYGIVFNQWSEDLGGFREIVRPTAVDGALAADMLFAGNHDFNFLLGSRAGGTGEIRVDDVGVSYRVQINEDDPLAMSFYQKVKRGDVRGSSFQFRIAEGGDVWTIDGDDVRREVTQFETVIEMGPVARPAYSQTSAVARQVVDALCEARHGSVSEDSRRVLEGAGIDLSEIAGKGGAPEPDPDASAGRARERGRKRLRTYL